MARRKQWFPLESNPAVLSAYASELGLPTHAFRFYDVLSVDAWALAMVPRPVAAVLMVFPKNARAEAFAAKEARRIRTDGQDVSSNVYFMKQTVGNACGTVGLLHAIGNMRHLVAFEESSYLAKLFRETVDKSPAEIGAFLANDDDLEEIHARAAQAGQSTQLERIDDVIETHFVCFSCVDGVLYELDGDKDFPINHGASSPDTLLPDACRVIQEFMARDKDEMRFTILALAKTQDDE